MSLHLEETVQRTFGRFLKDSMMMNLGLDGRTSLVESIHHSITSSDFDDSIFSSTDATRINSRQSYDYCKQSDDKELLKHVGDLFCIYDSTL